MTHPRRWVVCVGLVACPPWLPDQTPIDFCYGVTRRNMFMQSLPGPSKILQDFKQLWLLLMPSC
jgi:hypothetical protein